MNDRRGSATEIADEFTPQEDTANRQQFLLNVDYAIIRLRISWRLKKLQNAWWIVGL